MLELTMISPYLIVNNKDQLSTPTMSNADECFLKYLKIEKQPIGKRRVDE
jgi:hypothetical protein